MLASLAQRAAARLLQSSAAREARGGEGQRELDLEAVADAAADAARDLVMTRPTPKASASAAAAPAAAAVAKAREEFKWHNIFGLGDFEFWRRAWALGFVLVDFGVRPFFNRHLPVRLKCQVRRQKIKIKQQ